MRIFVPDGLTVDRALVRTTSLGIGAHPDDLEIMAASAIVEAYRNSGKWFCAVVVTDGSGSPRRGKYARYTDEQMRTIRREEQKRAAILGRYGSLILLDHSSAEVKKNRTLLDELVAILELASPEVVYTHNLADRHPTHVAVAVRTIEAIRKLPFKERPRKVLGCEVWRSLDWLAEHDKAILEHSAQQNLQEALLKTFVSQVAGGKRYDLAVLGRARANATLRESHRVDTSTANTFAMDLTPLAQNPKMDLRPFVKAKVTRFEKEVMKLLKRFG